MTEPDPMLPVPPPPGLTRRQRRMWATADEARRAQYAATHPEVDRPSLSRTGRRVFRQERTEQARQRLRAQRRALTDARARGAQIILGAIALVMAGFWWWPTAPEAVPAPGPAAAAPPTATTLAPPTTAPDPVRVVSGPQPAAVSAALTWWSVACQHTPDRWGPLQPLMTPAGWHEASSTPPAVVPQTWVCVDLNAEQDGVSSPDGTVVVRLTASRTVTPPEGAGFGPFVELASETRTMTLANGQWLVGTGPAN
jgi:hypothetical protein